MKIDEKTFTAMPADLQALFSKCPNPGSEEVVDLFPVTVGGGASTRPNSSNSEHLKGLKHRPGHKGRVTEPGSAARFFYCPKASKSDRDEGVAGVAGVGALRDGNRELEPRRNTHPTVKPVALMRYLCRLVTPPGGLVLDPFMGSGSTGKAAMLEGFRFIGSDLSPEYFEIAKARCTATVERVKRETAQQELSL